MNDKPGYHCIRVSDEVFERLLQRDKDPNVAVAKLVYINLKLDDPLEAALTFGFLSTRTYNALAPYWGAGFKTVGEVVHFDGDFLKVRHIGLKSMAEIRGLRAYFNWKNPEVRRRVLNEAENPDRAVMQFPGGTDGDQRT